MCLEVFQVGGKGFVLGDYRSGICEKMPEASPMSNRAKTSELQDGPTNGQGQIHQQPQQHPGIMHLRWGKSAGTTTAAQERSKNR